MTPASFQSWRKEQTTKAPKTLNEYLAMLSTFWTWLRKQSRVSVNPFELVERADTRGKDRIQRRALSDAESARLLEVAGKNQLAYMLPLFAGLRRNEAKTLRWCDLVLCESGGLLRLHAAVNKNRKEQSLPLHHDLAKALQQQKPAKGRVDDLVLVNGVPDMDEVRTDLEKAGIPFLDERGRRIDYHALRTTFITRLSTMKVHPRVAMELARHSDMRLTMKTYTDVGQLPLREVMDSLPGFGSDSRIDSRNLGATGQTVSQPVTETRELKTENTIANKGESHNLTAAVPVCHSEPESSGFGIRITTGNGIANTGSVVQGRAADEVGRVGEVGGFKIQRQLAVNLQFQGLVVGRADKINARSGARIAGQVPGICGRAAAAGTRTGNDQRVAGRAQGNVYSRLQHHGIVLVTRANSNWPAPVKFVPLSVTRP